jgi:hypothetical protein
MNKPVLSIIFIVVTIALLIVLIVKWKKVIPNVLKPFFYFAPIWSGTDQKPSIRRVLAIVACMDLVWNVHKSVDMLYKIITMHMKDKTIDKDIVEKIVNGLAQVAMIIGIEASLVVALLSLTTLSGVKSMQLGATEAKKPEPTPPPEEPIQG